LQRLSSFSTQTHPLIAMIFWPEEHPESTGRLNGHPGSVEEVHEMSKEPVEFPPFDSTPAPEHEVREDTHEFFFDATIVQAVYFVQYRDGLAPTRGHAIVGRI